MSLTLTLTTFTVVAFVLCVCALSLRWAVSSLSQGSEAGPSPPRTPTAKLSSAQPRAGPEGTLRALASEMSHGRTQACGQSPLLNTLL